MSITKSSYNTSAHRLLREQNGRDVLDNTENNGKTEVKRTWTIRRSYLGQFSCEDAVKMIIKSHMNAEEAQNV